MRLRSLKGFTLIELLVVIVILGVLAAISMVKYSNTKQRAWRANGIGDLRKLATAQEAFFSDSSRYAVVADTGSAAGRLNFQPSHGNTTLTLVASSGGWSGLLNIPGAEQCGIYSGTAAMPAGMPAATLSGVPVCW
ncbi:MAG: prepilin-type N-terminal cleavage/methylation domain-containing protein [Gemmatimonadaceae bacterium]|nr:prepilin-type N-terminal cleavage/methylation domain-containing protein [Gemmatimonadaceae bacterium]